jgi:protein SCO1/2
VRRRLVLVLALAVLLAAGVAIAAVVVFRGGETGVSLIGSPPPPGVPLPAFELPDQDGRLVRSSELRGSAVLVTFLDTQCTESCPIIGSVIGQAFRLLEPAERARVVAIAISTDPDEDTPASVEAFLRRNRVEGSLRYLVGPVDKLRPIWEAFQISASLDTGVDSLHSAPVRIFDRSGTWVATQHAGVDLSAENLAHDIRALLGGR